MRSSTDIYELARLSAVAHKLAESGSADAARRARAALDRLLRAAGPDAEGVPTLQS